MVTEQELVETKIGSVIAPAGCGKTELIAKAIGLMTGGRALVLTHTHAGVRALRSRLLRKGVPRDRVNIETIAGWALGYASAYPATSMLGTVIPENDGDWDNVYKGAKLLLMSPAVQKVLRASYVGVFVDEYQDCTRVQHELICELSTVLPCRVLGDPLQGIFGFAGASLSWKNDVQASFPSLGELDYPWRWEGKNEGLGKWLIDLREKLLAGDDIDLRSAPVIWKKSVPQNQRSAALELLDAGDPVVIIRKQPAQAHSFARSIGRAYRSMEEVECKDLMAFAKDVDRLSGIARASRVIAFAKVCMTGAATALASIQKALDQGALPNVSRLGADKKAVAEALIAVTKTSDVQAITLAMQHIEKIPGIRVFRLELWREAFRALDGYARGNYKSMHESAWATRNRSRYIDRPSDYYLVSRTLLIKGLEFEHAMVADVGEFSGRDAAKHFYVAATRGSKSLTLLSEAPILTFDPPSI